MGTDFKMDAAFPRELAASDFVRDVITDKASKAAAAARALAPDDPDTTDNDLHNSVYFDVQLGPTGWRGRVGATNFKAGWFENGTSEQAPRPFIGPAVEQEVGPIQAGGNDA